MKQTDETKKTAAPADEAEAPEAPKPGEPLSDAAMDAVSGGSRLPRGSESLLVKHARSGR